MDIKVFAELLKGLIGLAYFHFKRFWMGIRQKWCM